MNRLLTYFRVIAIVEGISLLLLVFIAMPLKYFAGMPMAVKFTGWIHGLFFVLYVLILLQVGISHRWSIKKMAVFFIASLLPFGPFVADGLILKRDKSSI